MSKVLVYVEGRTEERFVRQVLAPHLSARRVFAIPTLALTRRVKNGPDFKGGIVSYGQVKRDVRRLLGDSSAALVTTMIDYHGLPKQFPGLDALPEGTCYERVAHLERRFSDDVGHARFRPYFQLHEFEALVFADPSEVGRALRTAKAEAELQRIRERFGSPEEIDDDPWGAPSKHLAKVLPRYQKEVHGILVTARIGLSRIRGECRHFDEWVAALEELGSA